jgi:hypothetical protein
MPAGNHLQQIEADDGKTLPEVYEHVDLLKRAGLLEATIVPGVTGLPEGFIIHGLTWEGHDFIDAAKHDKVWKRVMDQVREKGGSVTMMVLKEMVAVVFKAYMTS